MITISSKLIFSDTQEIILLKDLMRRWSSALRYAYKIKSSKERGKSLESELGRAVKVVVVAALSPEGVLRALSVLKRVLFQGLWGDLVWARAPASGGRGVACERSWAIWGTP